jgi:hypothetical protein
MGTPMIAMGKLMNAEILSMLKKLDVPPTMDDTLCIRYAYVGQMAARPPHAQRTLGQDAHCNAEI